jgi:hypothetical protein
MFLDPGSEIRDPGWVKIRIRDKHPGSATLHKSRKKIKKFNALCAGYSLLWAEGFFCSLETFLEA